MAEVGSCWHREGCSDQANMLLAQFLNLSEQETCLTPVSVPVSQWQCRGLGWSRYSPGIGGDVARPTTHCSCAEEGGMALSLSHRNAAPATSSGTNSLFWLELSLCLGEQAVTPLYQWMKAIRLVCIRKAWRRSQEMPAHTVQGYCSPKPYPAVMPPLNQTTQTQRMVCTYSGSCLHVQAATGYLQVI